MRENDHVELVARARCAMHAADGVLELGDAEELFGGERADGDDELGAEDAQLAIEMRGAVCDLERIGNAIAACFQIAAGKAADHRRDVHVRAELLLGDERREPLEEPLARGVRERAAALLLARTRRLTDEHHARVRHGAGHGLAADVRTRAAGEERVEMGCKVAVHTLRS